MKVRVLTIFVSQTLAQFQAYSRYLINVKCFINFVESLVDI